MENRNEWVIHIWGKKREKLELTNVEKFHIDMLEKYQDVQKRFDKILINIALDEIDNKELFDFLCYELKKVLVNENVEIKFCENSEKLCEYVTFRPYVFDRIGEDVNIFYSHFKGYSSFLKLLRDSYPNRIVNLCEMFWSYIMYGYSFDFDDVVKHLKDKSVYCWYLFKRDYDKTNEETIKYDMKYISNICKGNMLSLSIEDYALKHTPGSFCWYNMKRLAKVLKDKTPYVTNISSELLEKNSTKDVNLFSHFCELYLLNFLKTEEIYSPNLDKTEWDKYKDRFYDGVYPMKKIGREFLKDFDMYLIKNKLI